MRNFGLAICSSVDRHNRTRPAFQLHLQQQLSPVGRCKQHDETAAGPSSRFGILAAKPRRRSTVVKSCFTLSSRLRRSREEEKIRPSWTEFFSDCYLFTKLSRSIVFEPVISLACYRTRKIKSQSTFISLRNLRIKIVLRRYGDRCSYRYVTHTRRLNTVQRPYTRDRDNLGHR